MEVRHPNKLVENPPGERGEREGEAPSGFSDGGGDVSPYDISPNKKDPWEC